MLTFICNAVDIKDNTTLIWSQTKFLRFSKRHILDYQLSIKQSVQECYQALFSVLAPKNTLESPVHTWVYISCHTINNFMGNSRNIAFRPQIYDFILKPPRIFEDYLYYGNYNFSYYSFFLRGYKGLKVVTICYYK